MFRKILSVALVAACSLVAAQESKAQSLGDLAAWNMAQDAQFMNWAWQGSMQVAQQIPNNVSSAEIIAAMQPHTTGNVYGGYNAGYWHNQAVQSNAMNNFSQHMRDEAYFTNPVTGQTYQLPYNAGGYYQDPAGWMYYGNHPTDYNGNYYYGR
jgi:hypothetical protein